MSGNKTELRVNSFANRNAVLVDTTWETYKKKSIVQRIISVFKGEADSVLNEKEVSDNFSFIHEKDDIIYSNIDQILNRLMTQGEIGEDDTKLSELLMHYIEKGYINKNDIRNSLNAFLISQVNYVYLNIRRPITGTNGSFGKDRVLIKETRNIWHDLSKDEKIILAYGIKNNILDEQQIKKLNVNTSDPFYNLEKFCEEYYDENLLDKYMVKLGINI